VASIDMALLIPSGAHFDRETLPKYEPNPTAVAVGEKLGQDEAFNKHMGELLEAHDRVERARQEAVPAAFPEGDPRRVLKDTILGFPAALFADLSRRLGDADPLSRLARRLSLWFKPFREFSRYGLPLAEDGRAVAGLVRRLVATGSIEGGESLQRLLAIWAGEVSLEADKESIDEILSLLREFPISAKGGLVRVVGLEICGALADEIDSLDVDTIEALFGATRTLMTAAQPPLSFAHGSAHGPNAANVFVWPMIPRKRSGRRSIRALTAMPWSHCSSRPSRT
jgi:hypothetical protein